MLNGYFYAQYLDACVLLHFSSSPSREHAHVSARVLPFKKGDVLSFHEKKSELAESRQMPSGTAGIIEKE